MSRPGTTDSSISSEVNLIADYYKVNIYQANAIYDDQSWGFEWGRYYDEGDTIVLFAGKPEHEKQLGMFRENVCKYATCSEIMHDEEQKRYVFAVLP